MLMRRWERARQGVGQLVLIVGEPGLGKSRLIENFTAAPGDAAHLERMDLLTASAEYATPSNRRMGPAAFRRCRHTGGAAAGRPGKYAGAGQARSGGERVAARAATRHPVAQGTRIDIGARGVAPPATGGPQHWVMASAKMQPVVLAFEDLHWADPTTLDVLRGIAERGAQVPLYIVATTRPEFRPPWGMRSHHGTISLAPLDRAQVRDMVGELSARHALSREVVDDVAARTGGVPLFVEEVTRLLLERGEQSGAQAIPPTLQQSLMARIDRLGSAREVAQIASVIGRGFSYKLLKAVAGMNDAPLEAALEKLSDADIVLVEGVLPESDYRFKHALIQDAAYENRLKSRRQILHRRIAETLRDRFADKAAAEPEVLAHHFTQAGLTDAAIEWWAMLATKRCAAPPSRRRSAVWQGHRDGGQHGRGSDAGGYCAERTAQAADQLRAGADFG